MQQQVLECLHHFGTRSSLTIGRHSSPYSGQVSSESSQFLVESSCSWVSMGFQWLYYVSNKQCVWSEIGIKCHARDFGQSNHLIAHEEGGGVGKSFGKGLSLSNLGVHAQCSFVSKMIWRGGGAQSAQRPNCSKILRQFSQIIPDKHGDSSLHLGLCQTWSTTYMFCSFFGFLWFCVWYVCVVMNKCHEVCCYVLRALIAYI